MSEFIIREAVIEDVPQILSFIKELAVFEEMLDMVTATEQDLIQNLFPSAGSPIAYVLMATTTDLEPAGFALYFHNYSTFTGKKGLYLEDLFIRESFRRGGLGTLFFAELKGIAAKKGCSRMEWVVLDWNKKARDFYTQKMGATELNTWIICRLNKDQLQ
ncbi:hypothetical protein HDV01_005585 [Terramyces sp. JEL0728]|nr:hypothetical protein HDV01_005585 [Terramyces sp. JEL0728]